MQLLPEAYEDAWKNDGSIRATAGAILEEWRGKVEQAEATWELTRLIESNQDPDRVLRVILAILALDVQSEYVDLLGAGPLEDLLSYSGLGCIDVIGQLATRNPRFKEVLGHVWRTSKMDSTVWQRVENIVGQSPKRAD